MKGSVTNEILDFTDRIDALAARDDYRGAFEVALDLAMKYERDYFLMELVETIDDDADNLKEPDDDTGSARDHFKYALWLQRFDSDVDYADDILYHLDRAYIKGSKLALYFYLQMRDPEGDEGELDPDEFILFLAEKGCAQVYPNAFQLLRKSGLYLKAIEYCDKADDAGFNMDVERRRLLIKYPDECCPWGRWRPNSRVHSWVTDEVHWQMFTWLLVAKRIGLSSFPTLLVCKYVCTYAPTALRNAGT
jgi:hypothetical protein